MRGITSSAKLENSKCLSRSPKPRSSGRAFCYSIDVWARSRCANKLNSACCLKPTNRCGLYPLAGTAPQEIRRTVAIVAERDHKSHIQIFLMNTTTPQNSLPINTRVKMWNIQLQDTPAVIKIELRPAESVAAWSDQPWLCWRSLSCLRTLVGRGKTTKRK